LSVVQGARVVPTRSVGLGEGRGRFVQAGLLRERWAWGPGAVRGNNALACGHASDLNARVKRDKRASHGGLPYNPWVRDLVQSKRTWSRSLQSEDLERGFAGWHERGYLPHRDEPGLDQFVTFHLADSFPVSLRSEWEAMLEVEDDAERRRQLEVYLDRGRGECYLRIPEIGQVMDEAFRFCHGRTYELLAWCVMPNHVHALPKTQVEPLGRIIAQFKKYTAREANRVLGRTGRFWAKDCWDTYMRDSRQELATIKYIESNPVKAFLVKEPGEWPWSSARFRDEYGRLSL
jgi:putative transposase